MRSLFLFLFILIFLPSSRAADPFEIREGDRVLLLGDTLLERENTYGYLETRMHEQFPDRKFTVRNLSWAGDTPRGVSRASFDPPEKGWERLKESIALVKPTVVFLGYGMAASLQEMTDRAQDITLNRDETRYGAEPMSAARFKKELGELMDAIGGKSEVGNRKSEVRAGNAPALPPSDFPLPTSPVRFVLLSPIRHEDLRTVKPGLPDPAPHNALLEQYSKAIEELAKEKGARYVFAPAGKLPDFGGVGQHSTENGIHLYELGYSFWSHQVEDSLEWTEKQKAISAFSPEEQALQAAILKKNELFFHRFRPENATYLFGFRKHEQGQNAKEIPMFDPLIDAAEAEIDKLKRAAGKGAQISPNGTPSSVAGVDKKSHRQKYNDRIDLIREDLANSDDRIDPIQSDLTPSDGRTGLRQADRANSDGGIDLIRANGANSDGGIQLIRADGASRDAGTTIIRADGPNRDGGIQLVQADQAKPDAAIGEKKPAGPIPAPATPPPLPDFTVLEGYQIELWAQNPLMEKPTQMNWDALGRLWVCSSSLYPQIEPGQPANDKILILEDTDRDGKADKSTVFADGLLIPTAVVPDFGKSEVGTRKSEVGAGNAAALPISDFRLPASACYVGQSTELLHFTDTDGDGKADTKRVVFSGFGTEDTHHLIHTLKWGPDGRLYWNQSIYIHSHLETPWGMVRLNSGGIFAYDPRTERVEVYAKGWCNPWGHAWDQWGQSFTTDGAGGQGISWVIPGAMYFTYENGRRIAPSVSPGSYPKFCSLEIIHSPHFPDDWQGNAIANDFRAHRIVRFAVEDLSQPISPIPPISPIGQRGEMGQIPTSGYVTKEMPDLVRTSDQSFRPIDVRLGPDGALYIADWSNPVINHGEVDFRDPRRDKHMGRIWRISKKDTPVVKWEPLVGKTNAELLEKLLSKSAWEQEGARRVIVGRSGDEDLMVKLTQMAGRQPQGGDDRSRLFAAYLLNSVQDSHFKIAALLLDSQSPQVRAASARALGDMVPSVQERVQAIPRNSIADPIGTLRHFTWLASAIKDPNPRVRVEAMRALSRLPRTESAALVLEAALNSPGESGAVKTARAEEKGGQFDKPTFSDTKDPYYGYAAWLSINDLAKPWTDAIASGAWKADTDARAQQLAWGLKAIDPALAGATLSRLVTENKVPLDGTGPWIELLGQAGGAKEITRLWTRVQGYKVKENNTPRILAALADAAKLRNVRPTMPASAASNLVEFLEADGYPESQRAAARLAGAWKFEAGVPSLVALTIGKDDAARNSAFEALREIGSEPARAALRQLAAAPNEPPIRGQAVAALAALDLNPALTFDALAVQPAEDAALNVWRGVLSVKDAADKLAASVPKEMPKPVATAGLRAAREAGKNGAKLLAALTPLAGLTDAEARMPKDFKALAAAAKQNGDPARGELIYRRAALACTVCHAIGGAGGKVGPDMTSLGASAPLDYIIESVINPAVKVKEGYNAVTFTMKDGTQTSGIQARETAQEIFLRDVTGREQAIAKAQIASTANLGSLMPAGVTDQLQDRERLDLFAFLGELGKPGPYDASKGSVARVWQFFSGADAAKVIASDPALDGAMPGYTLVDGRFVKDLLAASAPLVTNGADTMMAVAQFQSTGKTRLKITGAGKAWLDGKPLAISDDLAPELPAGVHTLAVRLDVKTFPEYLRAESPDARFLGN